MTTTCTDPGDVRNYTIPTIRAVASTTATSPIANNMADAIYTSVVTDKSSSIVELARKHRNEDEAGRNAVAAHASQNRTRVDRRERARMVWRKYQDLVNKTPNDETIDVLKSVDPDFAYLEHLGWKDQAATEEGEDDWLPSWRSNKFFSGYLKGTFSGWRKEWVDETQAAKRPVDAAAGDVDQIGRIGSHTAAGQRRDAPGGREDDAGAAAGITAAPQVAKTKNQGSALQDSRQQSGRSERVVGLGTERETDGVSQGDDDVDDETLEGFYQWYTLVYRGLFVVTIVLFNQITHIYFTMWVGGGHLGYLSAKPTS
ncbi:uncharacterized protein LY79DRAFT_679596 [Colletotrichum navitas]|uniref:Uncharacterized protein n=1 Tax=Colletotrichum navitas TaxID=681940 RepID=A0AAD8PM23_9PEZI|nr:uncharacterized protein LY79DRAFT_679596 [Colletotrichum navitas]KAK1569648.1 hypothetical protein LY79DRAFT_679596 [Colletotrichum navitas]